MRDGFKRGRETSPEEHGASPRKSRSGGAGNTWDGGGFPEGTHGRGPTPYKRAHSAAPAPLSAHTATSGRGGEGQFGRSDQHKGHSQDIQHPGSHAEFEALGADGD